MVVGVHLRIWTEHAPVIGQDGKKLAGAAIGGSAMHPASSNPRSPVAWGTRVDMMDDGTMGRWGNGIRVSMYPMVPVLGGCTLNTSEYRFGGNKE